MRDRSWSRVDVSSSKVHFTRRCRRTATSQRSRRPHESVFARAAVGFCGTPSRKSGPIPEKAEAGRL